MYINSFGKGMQPRGEPTDSRPDSPQSDDSSSESDLSSPSFNRDSDFDFAGKAKDVIEADSNRDNILAMAPIGGSFENESDSNSTVTSKTLLPSPKDTQPIDATDKKNRMPPKPVNNFIEFCQFSHVNHFGLLDRFHH